MKKKVFIFAGYSMLWGNLCLTMLVASSYGLVLRQIGVEDTGIVFGEPRPIRSDEWGVVTPFTQATVNNDFERYNKTSFYGEDLRINYGLPIFDWGLLFKPSMWGYLILAPEYAYSLHWFVMLAAFIVGYALLFEKLGLGRAQALLLSVCLYFTGFTQFWWNEKGPIFAIFPWVVLVLLSRFSVAARLGLFYWLGTTWLLTNFYPPLIISLAFVGVLLVLALGRDWLTPLRLLPLMLASAAASITAVLYLKDYLLRSASTIYPGMRSMVGGSVPWQEWWTQFFPFATFDWRYESVITGQNICEVGVAGSAIILMVICFLNYQKLRDVVFERGTVRFSLIVLGVGYLLMTAWMLLPLPAWLGRLLLWNSVQPERMEYAAGFVLLMFVAILGKVVGVRVTTGRFAVYLVLVVSGWLLIKGDSFRFDAGTMLRLSNDLVVIPVLATVLFFNRRWRIDQYTILIIAAAISSTIVLFGFNPIQSSKSFFVRHDTNFIKELDSEVQGTLGSLVFSDMPGATLNGLGYASVSHVTPIPMLEFWRKKYSDMKEEDFLAIFNRYAHIRLIPEKAPRLLQADAIGVPMADFRRDWVEISVSTTGDAAPLWLQQSQKMSGEIFPDRSGVVQMISVFIGNGNNSSDGVLSLKVCGAAGCTDASRKLAESIDNAFLRFNLTSPISVEKDQPVRYEFYWEHGQKPVAFWTYPKVSGQVTIQVNGVPGSLVPRFRLRYNSDESLSAK